MSAEGPKRFTGGGLRQRLHRRGGSTEPAEHDVFHGSVPLCGLRSSARLELGDQDTIARKGENEAFFAAPADVRSPAFAGAQGAQAGRE
jgi:hypothetical protein